MFQIWEFEFIFKERCIIAFFNFIIEQIYTFYIIFLYYIYIIKFRYYFLHTHIYTRIVWITTGFITIFEPTHKRVVNRIAIYLFFIVVRLSPTKLAENNIHPLLKLEYSRIQSFIFSLSLFSFFFHFFFLQTISMIMIYVINMINIQKKFKHIFFTIFYSFKWYKIIIKNVNTIIVF